jgi:hypothetical protein
MTDQIPPELARLLLPVGCAYSASKIRVGLRADVEDLVLVGVWFGAYSDGFVLEGSLAIVRIKIYAEMETYHQTPRHLPLRLAIPTARPR